MGNKSIRSSRYRYRQIATVLAQHGLGVLIDILGLGRLVDFRLRLLGRPRRTNHYSTPERVRMVLEELGTTFMKLGQILSTRSDLLPPEYQHELAKLQDQAPPLPCAVVQQILVKELGGPVERYFAGFDLKPLAAASIGQVHAATRLDGTEVIIKIRRPGVIEQVEQDLEILTNLASTANRRWTQASQYDLVGLAQEFAQTLRAELDYIREGHSAERFAANFAGNTSIHIPRVYWETTTSSILTLERIRGIKINDVAALDAAGINRTALAKRASHILLKMIFEDGFYHADPHPGNFFVESNGRISVIDFGLVGTIDERTQDQLVRLLLAVTNKDADRLVDSFMEIGIARRHVDRGLLRQDFEHLFSRYYTQALGDLDISLMFDDILTLIRRHHLQLPSNLALLMKTMVMDEGLGAQLDPNFRLITVLIPYAQRLIMRQYMPAQLVRKMGEASLEMVRLSTEFPQHLQRIVGDLERGGLDIGIRPVDFEPVIHRLERLANRIVLGILAASFINGLAILLSVYHPPGWDHVVGIFFATGFIIAGALGAYLAWCIVRSE